MDREGDRRFCCINAAQFPFWKTMSSGRMALVGQRRMGIFGVINDDFGATCDDRVQNGDETGVAVEAVVTPVARWYLSRGR